MGLGWCKFVIAPPFLKKGGCTCPHTPSPLATGLLYIYYLLYNTYILYEV